MCASATYPLDVQTFTKSITYSYPNFNYIPTHLREMRRETCERERFHPNTDFHSYQYPQVLQVFLLTQSKYRPTKPCESRIEGKYFQFKISQLYRLGNCALFLEVSTCVSSIILDTNSGNCDSVIKVREPLKFLQISLPTSKPSFAIYKNDPILFYEIIRYKSWYK